MTRPCVQRPIMFTLACAACSVLALSAVLTWSAHAQTSAELTQQTSAVRTHNALPRHVLQTLQKAEVPPSALSVLIAPLPHRPATKSGKHRHLSHQAHASVNPASVMKLFTTYAGLSLLGPEYVWRNRVYTDGSVRDGVLQGNLVVRGSGDPKLVVERLQALMLQIRAAGVREVRGDIVLDRSVFDVRERSEPFDDEPLRPYNVGPDGLLLNFKAVVYTFTPDAASGQVQVRFEPPLAGFSAPTQLPLTRAPCSDWRRQLQADFSQAQQVRFAGRYPASCGEREWPVAYPEPEAFAPRVMQALWQQAGGQLTGQVRYGTRPASAKLLLEAPSLPLSEIIKDINKFSNNVMAQQLYLTLSSEMGAPGRFEASRMRLSQWWRQGFAGHDEPVLDNGSGLSRTERSTAQALTALLQAAHASPHAQHFLDSLAIAGVDGTAARLKDRSPQSPVIGKAWLKTGSLRDVASVAGYVQGQSGQRYTLVAVLHHPNAQQARGALDQLLEWTVRDQASPPKAQPSDRINHGSLRSSR
ncbi:D-alanyl-D-alanine carboxypeptidase/D-alanyl-D-alanine-endopeptidase [Limnohabitans sp. Rim8]|uniref:D-alanyl-D-alanine carboxypeptidase/D-alanyl-D-alanine endopeptidase n=1 Tax=Limnohabitans sp. Rim8 TaxID=1100718 RepID=UPI0025E4C870|nr:D-alanyl-D-alanine carboxypeptidase/D-alanyl-D-alanine-endopeptidase [Limnohabitans sp. Rim8]